MRKTRIRTVWLAAAAAAALLVACGGGSSDPGPVLVVGADGTATVNAAALQANLAALPTEPLSAAERDGLLFMREEEQLARDVYLASAARYAQPSFGNIAASEATHAAAVATLLARYGVADPMAGLATGRYASPAFQALYDALVASSATGLVAALQVGLEIEELDIRDLRQQLAAVDNADIALVYGQLMRGSRNHLRAYASLLARQGGSYVPKYISQADYDAIVASPIETGP